MAGRIQDGIFFRSGDSPPPFFSILFLRATAGCTAAQVGETLAALWEMYRGLQAGQVRDLPGQMVPPANLSVLLGMGTKAFALDGVARPRPPGLDDSFRFVSAKPAGGGKLLPGAGLSYANEVRLNPATEEFAVQFLADTRLGVERGVVETWKFLADARDPATGGAPLEPGTFYLGTQREDARSWIDFHDGISNLRSDERERVIAIPAPGVPDDAWTLNGTYLAFIRLGIDLVAWRALDRRRQELAVGRDKLTGCPLVSVDAAGVPTPAPGCPAGGPDVTAPGNDAFRETGQLADPALRRSHIQRANHHQEPSSDPSSRRIYRQGYPFLEWQESAPGFRAGLNFVSFQDTPERLVRTLTSPSWLGVTNFGGDEPALQQLLTVYAAGIYLVPPAEDGETFPGASVLRR
jgi:Dyp-type peroxidase family